MSRRSGGVRAGWHRREENEAKNENRGPHCSNGNFSRINVTILRPCPALPLCPQIQAIFSIQNCTQIRSLAKKFLADIAVACDFGEGEK